MYGYYYKAGKTWEDVKLWEATKDNPQEDINVESFLEQDNYWNIGSFKELLKADYSFPVILDEEYKLVDGAHRLVHAYIDGKTHIKGVIIKNNQWPEPDHDENKECQNTWKPSEEQIHAIIEALKYLPNNKDEWMVLNTLVDVFKKLI